MNNDNRQIIRCKSAGVFFATIESLEGDTAVLTNCRRLWYWAGAASLSELAQRGTSAPRECKFPTPVDRARVYGVIEILDTTPEARASIDAVPVWSV